MMKYTLMALALFMGVAVCGAYGARPRPSDQALIAKEEDLNDKCRGGLSTLRATMAACDRREAVLGVLEKRNICWGPSDSIEAEKHWVRCKPQKP
ncbi:hypothetical protein NO263_09980 [Gluconacetobacter entanii]|uniref:Uncharacterized protein n=1 Tax=Gluconacetobacter entanii TaxID=108528 RepID=A0ABT3K660_9PROT|nr:hypothetical protein [Gluconacetobacter entanii]MCW4590908.1 hypothetical protein [Gluconacetobacter entanii]MCW4592521.1 hypothetical protein [Gluconacetobacter entanii]NPC87319.1 hypothetical protein [Gluconacetobacter entanii]